jgi:hypothetical protein
MDISVAWLKDREIGQISTQLLIRGWSSYDVHAKSDSALRGELTALADHLGTPVASRAGRQLCDKLCPTEALLAKPNSLSEKYSLGEFPCHSDTAHWVIPCRFVVLACVSPGAANRPTFLLDTKSLPIDEADRKLLYRAPFRIRNGKNSFFGTILSKARHFVRYDPGCMHPVDASAKQAMGVFSKERWSSYVEKIAWTEGRVVIIDNWRVLHARGRAETLDHDRILLRILIE